MKRTLIFALLLLGGAALQAQEVAVGVNHGASFTLTPDNGIYFTADTMTIDGTSFAVSELTVITFGEHVSISNAEEAALLLAPNPASHAVTLRGIGSGPQSVSLFNLMGVEVMRTTAVDGTSLDISRLPDGIYLLRCGMLAAKIIKKR